MADFYMDTDAGSDANNGTTWALAKLTLEGLLAVMSAGDTGFVQGAADDTSASARTFSSSGIATNPVRVVGVADGTTNEPPVASDIAVTLPKVSTTSTGTISFSLFCDFVNIHFTTAAADTTISANNNVTFTGCQTSWGVEFNLSSFTDTILVDHTFEPLTTGDVFRGQGGFADFYNCNWIFTGGDDLFRSSSNGIFNFFSCDISTIPTNGQIVSNVCAAKIKMSNCKLPSTAFTLASSFAGRSFIELIGCNSNTSAKGATTSYQDYQYEDIHGSIDLETTAVRTGGADDGASGAFAYAMTPRASATLESSNATLKSPWLGPIWVEAGASTATVYVANDGAGDYNEDEMWCEFYTVDVGDTAQHDQNFDPADARLFASSTAITDDTGSTWGTGGSNHQKMSTGALTYGFEGPIYARVHVAKRQVTPDTVFLDPLIEIS